MTQTFEPSRTAALEKLARFVPKAGRDYAARRNYDLGPGRHDAVSTLSPYIRHRVLTESEVLTAVLGRFSASSAEKFIQEVFWRTYWKGWLEQRPSVWDAYRNGVKTGWDQIQSQSGLRAGWEAACKGETHIACFNDWAQELVETGYLHNHARMWFASIWIFTLRLPWELGADFFLRHLLDGDPASNTLSWRWVAGLHTQGKTYIARSSNISKYTKGRFAPEHHLATHPEPLDGPPHPQRRDPPTGDPVHPGKRSVLLLHDDDLNPGWLFDLGVTPVSTATLTSHQHLSPLHVAPAVGAFKTALMDDAVARWSNRMGTIERGLQTPAEIEAWARSQGADQIVSPYAPVGPSASVLAKIRAVPVIQPLRDYDRRAWPHATAGFFKFKKSIPDLIAALKGLQTV